ncbi:uncharacterized protein EI90DRAFT_2999506 [Cantharellus anzutake]|uniref:uncharacterized protein n=1 Tax=Cantharellus anzutake TaxID=1750568 RepID=UPI0019067751|nr:uncharacterized protein EI90DRAFT_2999506 [Cantharellus anzutake]KAF8326010.1 hypothetical protein EI90DRAFT_2999506 [Cantharellus anzutake]
MTPVMRSILPLIFSLFVVVFGGWADPDIGKRDLLQLTSAELNALVSIQDPTRHLDPADSSSHLSKILIPRVPNTPNSTLVRRHIVSTFRALKWDVEEDAFTGRTPYGSTKFTNIIATKDPKAATKLVLSVHYDSKFYPNYPDNQFVGATDSAAACAMLLDLAQSLDPLLERRKRLLESQDSDEIENPAAHTTLQIIFFDGEEAFRDWTSVDSTYGSRHLAEKWENKYVEPHPARRLNPPRTVLSTIEHLILLDLLGAPNPIVPSFYPSTGWIFDALISAETRLEQSGHLISRAAKKSSPKDVSAHPQDEQTRASRSFFKPRRGAVEWNGWIDDDHMPFLQRGVSILHVIPNPFPRVWHTLKDDASALHVPTMRKWNLVFRVFVAEYLGLHPDTARRFGPLRKEDLVRNPCGILVLSTDMHPY